jgi:hypothetical protein
MTDLRTIIREELDDRMMNTREACELMGMCYNTLQKAVKSGDIKARVIAGTTMYRRGDLLAAGHGKYDKYTHK